MKLYPLETVVAKKWQAMAELGEANSRMKDFYGLWILSRRLRFDGAILSRAIAATFERRQTPLPDTLPVALRDEFSGNASKQTQWRAFVRRSRLEDVPALPEVTVALLEFLWPVTQAARARSAFEKQWEPSSECGEAGWREGDHLAL